MVVASAACHTYKDAFVCILVPVSTEPDTCDLLCLDVPKAERVRAAMPSVEELERRAAAAKALGDPTRLALAVALGEAGTACVCDLAWIAGRSERLVSHHARQLKAAGVARSRRDGKMVMYELTEHGAELLAKVLGPPEEAAR